MINKLVVENLKHRPVRTLLSVIAISIQVTMVLTLVGLSRGMLDEQARRARGVGADVLIRPPGGNIIISGGQMQARIIPVIVEKQLHVSVASGVLIYATDMFNYVTGVDLATFNKMSGGFRYVQGGPFQHPDDVLVDTLYAAQRKLHVGDSTSILNRSWRVAGIYEPGMLARMVVPLDVLQDLTANTGKISMIYVKLDDPAKTNEVIAALTERLKEYKVYSMEEFMTLFSPGNFPWLLQFTYVVISLGVLVGFLVVFLSMYTAVLERTREIGILKALGASPSFILNVLLRETTLLAIAGSALGFALSYATRYVIAQLVPATFIQAIVYDWWPITAGLALAGALLGALYPGLKAARQDAIEALAYE